ncbi:hypothetical protein MOD89_18775 [Bacillus atrophaeus]|nr:hypothetical protein [Bacillus atrophaeus]
MSSFSYYGKQGDKYKAFTRTGENDRLGLSKKTPDYEEAKDKETELEE